MSVYTHTKKLWQNDSWGKDINTNIWKWGFSKNIWARDVLSGRRGNVSYWVVYCTGGSFVFVGRVAGSVVVEVQIIKLSKLWPELGGGDICVGLWRKAVVKRVLKDCEFENEVNGWTLEGQLYGRYNYRSCMADFVVQTYWTSESAISDFCSQSAYHITSHGRIVNRRKNLRQSETKISSCCRTSSVPSQFLCSGVYDTSCVRFHELNSGTVTLCLLPSSYSFWVPLE